MSFQNSPAILNERPLQENTFCLEMGRQRQCEPILMVFKDHDQGCKGAGGGATLTERQA